MIMDGLKVMLIGMSVVFLMLMFIIVLVPVSAAIIRRFERPAPDAAVPAERERDPGIIAAMTAAITRFKARDQK